MRENVTAGSNKRNENIQEQYKAPESSVQMGQDFSEVHFGLNNSYELVNHERDDAQREKWPSK